MLLNYNHIFPSFTPESRIWIYTSSRELTLEEVKFVSNEMKNFVASWNAHGKSLNADSVILYNRFLILTVDEGSHPASGCSIDSSVKTVKFLGEKLKIDFFDRLKIYIEKDNEFKRIPFFDLKDYPEWNYFNPMIVSLESFRNEWYLPIQDSTLL